MSPAVALLVRDVKLAWREGGAIGVVLGFYLVVVAIMPFGLGPDLNLLARIAPGPAPHRILDLNHLPA